jgi:hypothetical protein
MSSITLQSNSITFLSGFLFQENYFIQLSPGTLNCTKYYSRRVQICYKTLKIWSYVNPYPNKLVTYREWFWKLWNFSNRIGKNVLKSVWNIKTVIFYLFNSILFYSILFYSILFYSILFYSILFYSFPFF